MSEAPEGTQVQVPEGRRDWLFTFVNLATTLAAVVLPFFFTTWHAVAGFLISYTVSGLCLTAGFHRLFAHSAYKVPLWLERAMAIGGFLALQRGPIFWVSMHRLHHQFTEVPGRDPHAESEGVWHVHFDWMQHRRPEVWDPEQYRRRARDFLKDPLYVWMDEESSDYLAFFALVGVSFAVGGALGGGLTTFDLYAALAMTVWVGLLPRVALLHAFGMVNSVCHRYGARPFADRTGDHSTNNPWVAAAIFGEGWHNNHHAFPTSARHGLLPGQIDLAWQFIRLLEVLGLATDVRVASIAGEPRGPKT